jgi:hypothetical protein
MRVDSPTLIQITTPLQPLAPMKDFRPRSCRSALYACLLIALVTPFASVYANAPVTDKITGRAPQRHYFANQSSSAQYVLNAGYYALMTINYAGTDLVRNQRFDQGPRRSNFGGITTVALDWYQTITVRIEVYRESNNQKLDTFNWSAKLTQEPGVGFSYRCAIPSGERVIPFQAALNFCYERGTDPAASSVNVFVR